MGNAEKFTFVPCPIVYLVTEKELGGHFYFRQYARKKRIYSAIEMSKTLYFSFYNNLIFIQLQEKDAETERIKERIISIML